MQIDHDTLVLVVDGRKMLMFRNEGDARYPNLRGEKVEEIENPATREQATHPAGRSATPAVMGSHQDSYAHTDFHRQEEDRFAADAAALLKKRALADDFERLIVVAPPQMLGEMRKHYHKAVEQRLVGEIAKDLTDHPVPEIEKIVSAS
ncbi:MAG: host attachment family protein [Sphingobium sp.]